MIIIMGELGLFMQACKQGDSYWWLPPKTLGNQISFLYRA
jgi:hypothetical protein